MSGHTITLGISSDFGRAVIASLENDLMGFRRWRKRFVPCSMMLFLAAFLALGIGFAYGWSYAFGSVVAFSLCGWAIIEVDVRISRRRKLIILALTLLVRTHDGHSPELTAIDDMVVFDQKPFAQDYAGLRDLIHDAFPALPKNIFIESSAIVEFWTNYGLCEPGLCGDCVVFTGIGRAAAMAFRNSPLLAVG